MASKYGMKQSHQRLMRDGFNVAVTTKTPREAMLLMRHGQRDEASREDDNKALVRLTRVPHISDLVANQIFEQGAGTVLNVIVTSSALWHALANAVRIWDFHASEFQTNGTSGVFLAVAPDYKIGDMIVPSGSDVHGVDDSARRMQSWLSEAMEIEENIYLLIHQLHERMSSMMGHDDLGQDQEFPRCLIEGPMSLKTLTAIRNIRHRATLRDGSQFLSSSGSQSFQPQALFALKSLRKLLDKIMEQRMAHRVLYFQSIPFLDRRMIALILRACPRVCMVGIYDCPLLHFGDVLCLIDLIYEVNFDRRRLGQPEITALDFSPVYHYGDQTKTSAAATYGLTWGPHKLDVVQRGFFTIIMKAFLKARRMKLQVLFDRDSAFCRYLHQVPNYPLAVPTFLDALYRYMAERDKKKRRTILYDLLKPIRFGLECDGPEYYEKNMGEYLAFCSSCGYSMLQEFYSAVARNSPPNLRICAGCTLQKWMDEEKDHLKPKKKKILNILFAYSDGRKFNHEAPLPQAAETFIRFQTANPISVGPTIHMSENGEGYATAGTNFSRNNRVHFDSLQGLPTLEDLLSESPSEEIWKYKPWDRAYEKCQKLDVYCRAIRRVCEEGVADNQVHNIIAERFDGGMPDHDKERQPPKWVKDGVPCHDFKTATLFYAGLVAKGWAAAGATN